MALSRFWSFIIVLSIVFVFYQLFTGGMYSIGELVNGKQHDPIVISEISAKEWNTTDTALYSKLLIAKEDGVMQNDTMYRLLKNGNIEISHGQQNADGIFATCKNTIIDIWLPLIGYLTFFCGLLHLLHASDAISKLSKVLTPFFKKIFPELPEGHEAYGFMTMNFAANFLGLDNAATPFGLKAMESMQEANKDKETASNSQIMFLCLHAAGLTLIPTSIIGYRAAQNATNPSDIMIPCIITSFVGTLAALILVSIKQRINLINWIVIGAITIVSALIALVLFYIGQLNGIEKFHFTGNLSNGVLLAIILGIIGYSLFHEKIFRKNDTNIFDSFVHGAKDGFTTGVRVLPYMIAMLVALSIFRNSGLMNIVMSGITRILSFMHVDPQVINAIPVALMRPFSAGGSRGFMLDAMNVYGADSLTGQLACLFQGAAETTFYVVALYYGSVNIKNSRYTLGIMLTVDLICVVAGIFVCYLYF